MSDRPIIFSAPMVRALLAGRKSQTRRVLKPPYGTLEYLRDGTWRPISIKFFPGDRLYVREAHALVPSSAYRMSEGVEQAVDPSDPDLGCVFTAGWDRCKPRWRPSIHMPRWASRLTLVVTDVRVQRLQEISEADAAAEGLVSAYEGWATDAGGSHWGNTAVNSYRVLWNDLHGPDAWDANPWVAAITFTVHHVNIDQMEAAHG